MKILFASLEDLIKSNNIFAKIYIDPNHTAKEQRDILIPLVTENSHEKSI